MHPSSEVQTLEDAGEGCFPLGQFVATRRTFLVGGQVAQLMVCGVESCRRRERENGAQAQGVVQR